jgi:hypothetical protein
LSFVEKPLYWYPYPYSLSSPSPFQFPFPIVLIVDPVLTHSSSLLYLTPVYMEVVITSWVIGRSSVKCPPSGASPCEALHLTSLLNQSPFSLPRTQLRNRKKALFLNPSPLYINFHLYI